MILTTPASAMNGTNENRVVIDRLADPGNPLIPQQDDRAVDFDESEIFRIDPAFEAGPPLSGTGMEYQASWLWSDLNDMHVEDGIMYLGFTYGLQILDISEGLPFTVISKLYLQTTYGRGDKLEKYGDYVYYTRAAEVAVIDVSDIDNPSVAGSFPSEGEFVRLTCADDVLYLLDKDYGLKILDVSDPPNPALLKATAEFGTDLFYGYIDVSGGIAVMGERSKFKVLDVSDPANPVLLADLDIQGASNAVLTDSLACVFSVGVIDSIITFDMRDPANPARSGALTISDQGSASDAMMPYGPYLITAGEVIDISDPSAPYSTNTYNYYNGMALGIWNDTLYRKESTRILVYDVVDIEDPQFTGGYVAPDHVTDVYVRDSVAFVSLLYEGLVILDISDVDNAAVLSKLNYFGDFIRIDVQDNILCSARYVVDISDPSQPMILADLGNQGCYDFDLEDKLLYRVSKRNECLKVYDMSDPQQPVLMSTYEMEFNGGGAKIAVKDTLAFLATDRTGTAARILSYADPSAPELIGTYGDSNSRALAVDGNIMYTVIGYDLHIVDIQNPRNPSLVGIFNATYWWPKSMVSHRGILYTRDRYGNNVVFDVSDPTNPAYLENFRTPSSGAVNLFALGDNIFIADYYGLMQVYTPYDKSPAKQVAFDVKPGSCPNPLNWKINPKGKSVIPAAICGSGELDVRDIDISSLRLLGELEPVRSGYEDVSAPVEGDGDCACTKEGPDGYLDLTLKFDRRAVLEMLHLLPEADSYLLTVTGLLADGERIEGNDCVHPVGRGQGSPGDGLVADSGSGDKRTLEGSGAETAATLRNYPNPFNPMTEIRFSLPEGAHVTLDIYNVAGHRVATLADEHLEAGAHAVTWNGTGISGQPVASGVYFYRLRTGTVDITKKMLLLR
jgi:hypothetical protein